MYTNFCKNLIFIFVLVIGINVSGALPGNISVLVEKSAPAVVNITAKNVSQNQSYGLGGLLFLMKCLKGLEFPDSLGICHNKREKLYPMAQDLF